MKKKLTSGMKKLGLLIASLAMTVVLWAQDYKLTFSGSGESEAVDQVLVENLTQGTQLTMAGINTLHLKKNVYVAVDQVASTSETQRPEIYPNPSNGQATLRFTMPGVGNTVVSIRDLTGRLMQQKTATLTAGSHTFILPAMPSGIYMVSVDGANYHRAQKWICTGNTLSGGRIELQGTSATLQMEAAGEPPIAKMPQSPAATAEVIQMQYNENDLLRISGNSGDCSTIVMKRVTVSQDVNFKFVLCRDEDGNHYPIVKIGPNYWMAEDLRVTSGGTGIGAGLEHKTSSSSWAEGWLSFAYYNFGSVMDEYGVYYNNDAANYCAPKTFSEKKQWVLPSADDYKLMIEAANELNGTGSKLKATGRNSLWTTLNGTNETGFGALGCGYITEDGKFTNAGEEVRYWASGSEVAYVQIFDNKSLALVKVSMPPFPLKAGMKVRYMLEESEVEPGPVTIEDIFGEQSPQKEDIKPLGEAYTLSDNYTQLFLAYGEKSGDNFTNTPQVRLMRHEGTGNVSVLPSITASATKRWCSNKLKKIVSQKNADGRENMIIGVLNQDTNADGSGNWYDFPANVKLTFHIFQDSVANYKETEITVDKTFTMPNANNFNDTELSRNNETGKLIGLYWHFQLLPFDYNRDGIDDVVACVNRDLVIFDGKALLNKKTTILAQRNFASDHSGLAATRAFYLRAAIGDVDDVRGQDIVVMTCAPTATSDRVKIHVFSDGIINSTSTGKAVDISGLTAVGGNLAVGNVDDKYEGDEIVVSIKENESKIRVGYFNYRESKDFTDFLNVVTPDYGPMKIEAIETAHLKGGALPADIITANSIYRVGDDGLTQVGNVALAAQNDGRKNKQIFADQIVVGNFENNIEGREQLIYFICGMNGDNPDNQIYIYKLSLNGDEIVRQQDMELFNEGKTSLKLSGSTKQMFPVLGTARSNRTARLLKYKGYELVFARPTINVVLAAAPYYADKNNPGETYWGTSKSSGLGTSSEYTIETSLIMGFEMELRMPVLGIKLGGIEMTSKISAGVSSEYKELTTITHTTTRAIEDVDAVVISTIPYDMHTYTIETSDNKDEIGTELILAFPQEPVEKLISFDLYKEYMRDDPKAPQVWEIFKHTPGNPYSYPTSETSLSNVSGSAAFICTDNFTSVGDTGYTGRSITIDKETTQSTGWSVSSKTELVVNTGGVKLGTEFGFGNTNTITKTIGQSTEVGGLVRGFTADDTHKHFSWNIVWYNYTQGEQTFSVVNYLVK